MIIVLIAERSGRFCAYHWPAGVCKDGLDGRAAAGQACKPLRGGLARPGVEALEGGREGREGRRFFDEFFAHQKRVHPTKRHGGVQEVCRRYCRPYRPSGPYTPKRMVMKVVKVCVRLPILRTQNGAKVLKSVITP